MKKIILLLIAAILTLSFAACTPEGGGGDITTPDGALTLRLWTPISGPDATIFNKLVAQFNQENQGDILVNHQPEMRENHYKNIKNNVPDNGPDMAILHSQLVQNYADQQYIVPIDESFFTEDMRINPDDYLQKVVNTLYYNDQLYGVPLDVHPIVLYYNKQLVGNNTLPSNYSELIALTKALTKNNVYGLPVSTMWPSEFLFTTALYQNGGQEITPDSEPLFNSESGHTAAGLLRDLIHKDGVSPNSLQADQDLNMFTSGQAAFHIQGSWALSALVDALGDNLGVMSMSNMFAKSENVGKGDVMARSHVFTVTKTRRAMSTRKKQAITKFIKWMGENSAEWAKAGQIPAHNGARNTEAYEKIPYLSEFGNPDNFRTPAPAVYFESGYETIFEYITTIMKNNSNDAEIATAFNKAENEAKTAVRSEREG